MPIPVLTGLDVRVTSLNKTSALYGATPNCHCWSS